MCLDISIINLECPKYDIQDEYMDQLRIFDDHIEFFIKGTIYYCDINDCTFTIKDDCLLIDVEDYNLALMGEKSIIDKYIEILQDFRISYLDKRSKRTILATSIITTAQNIVKSLKPKNKMEEYEKPTFTRTPNKGKIQQITKRQTKAYKAAQKRKAAMVSQSRKQNRK